MVVAFLIAVGTLPAAAQEALQLRDVTGTIVNGTANSLPAFGLTVTLHRQTATTYEESTTTTDTKGTFRFEDIPLDPEALYGVTVRYQGVVYGTDIDLRPESIPPVTVNIYETSDDQSLLSVSSSSLLIPQVDKIARDVYALEIVNVVNSSDRTYVPGAEPMNLLRFGLPPGAKGLQIDTSLVGADAIQVDRGFAVPANIPPGEHEVMFAYHFGYEGQSVTLDKSYLYGAEKRPHPRPLRDRRPFERRLRSSRRREDRRQALPAHRGIRHRPPVPRKTGDILPASGDPLGQDASDSVRRPVRTCCPGAARPSDGLPHRYCRSPPRWNIWRLGFRFGRFRREW